VLDVTCFGLGLCKFRNLMYFRSASLTVVLLRNEGCHVYLLKEDAFQNPYCRQLRTRRELEEPIT